MIWNQLSIYTKSVIQLVLIAAGLYLLFLVRSILLYFVIAAIISLVAKPITLKITQIKWRNKSFPRSLAAVVTLLLLLAVFGFINMLIFPEFIKELTFLSKIDFSVMLNSIQKQFQPVLELLDTPNTPLLSDENGLKNGLLQALNLNLITQTINGIVGGLGNLAAATFSILFMLFFFLKEKDLTQALINGAVPNKHMEKIQLIVPKIKKILGRYFRGLLVQMAGIFTLVYLGLTFVAGVENALVIALFAALINLIPYIGPIIGLFFGLFICLGQAYALGLETNYTLFTLKILLVFGLTQITDNILFQPLIFSNSVNAHPLEIFIVIAIAGTIYGATGMIVAVPLYSILRIFAKAFLPNLKFVQSLTKDL